MNDTISEKKLIAADILIQTKSVLFNASTPFTYTSGKQGPVYVDCRRLIAFPQERTILMDMAADLIMSKCDNPDFIAGGETAGIPYAAFIAERLEKPMLYVRKKPKGFGRMAQIEGHMEEDGQKVILVEDLQTDGGSKKVFIDALREAGGKISHTFVIFHYGIFAESEANMKAMDVTLHALTDWWHVLEIAKQKNYFDTDTLESVERYLNAPAEWVG